MTDPKTIYTVGGTVQAVGGIYIKRAADQELLELCRAGELAFILSSRQVGKSSLMVRTAEELKKEGVRSVIIDLSAIGVNVTPDEWYLGILNEIAITLDLESDIFAWWGEHAGLSPVKRLSNFFRDMLLKEVSEHVVLFFDEIDSTLSIPFSDDFFAALRAIYNARSTTSDFKRLSFVLIGVATPSDLISDSKRTPFNIGRRVELSDFTPEEAAPLAKGLGENAEQVLGWIFDWTSGHPYLTQRLCAHLSKSVDGLTKENVAQAVETLFIGGEGKQDNNLQFVRDMLLERARDTKGVLRLYREVLQGKQVEDNEQSINKTHLKLSGVVRRMRPRHLKVSNQIYQRVFDLKWIKDYMPRLSTGVVGTATLALLVIFGLSSVIYKLTRLLKTQELVNAARRTYEIDSDLSLLLGVSAAEFDHPLFSSLGFNLSSNNPIDALLIVMQFVDPNYFQAFSGHTNGVNSVAFSPDGKILASGGDDDTIRLWDVEMKGLLGEPLIGHTESVNSVAFSPDGKTLASGSSDETIILWKVETRRQLGEPLIGHTYEVDSVAFSPDGKTLASGSGDRTIRLWDVETGQQLGEPLIGHTNGVNSIAFSPDGKILASGSDDNTIRLWDVITGQQVGEPLTEENAWPYTSVAFSPEGKILASGSAWGPVDMWDIKTGLKIKDPYFPYMQGASVLSVAFSLDGKILASGSNDRTIWLWDVKTSQFFVEPLRGHAEGINSIAFSPISKLLASGSKDTTVRIWDVDPKSLKAKACQHVGRNLSREEWNRYFGLRPYQRVCPQWPVGMGVNFWYRYWLYLSAVIVAAVAVSVILFWRRRRSV